MITSLRLLRKAWPRGRQNKENALPSRHARFFEL